MEFRNLKMAQNGKAEGFGTYKHNDGAKYEGYWKNDKQDGRGVEMWPDHTRYEGGFLEGKKNGRGAYVCFSKECFDKARKNHGLERSLKMTIPQEIYEKLEAELAGNLEGI